VNKTKIDWADSSFNPITGCYHDCPYCYARGISTRFKNRDELIEPETYHLEHDCREIIECNEQPYFIKNGAKTRAAYPYGFTPCIHRYRMNEYQNKKGRNIFVCSMADMWGNWVPDRWIIEVLSTCEKAPQHNYLFLTKNPARYIEFFNRGELPGGDNFWYGTTVNTPDMLYAYSESLHNEANVIHHTFLSIEPIFEDFGEFKGGAFVDWVIVGAETGNRKGKVIPQKEWIKNIVNICRQRNIPVFMKESLRSLMGCDFIQEFPKELAPTD